MSLFTLSFVVTFLSSMQSLTISYFRDGNVYIRDNREFIGTKYIKAVYREFTDGSFKHLVKRSFRDYHLGVLGPFVRVQVGDTLEIVYKNMVNFPNTINMRNLKGENHMVREQAENGVAPGKTATFRWYVPERSGPGPFDPNCVGRSYDSTTNPLKDSNTGLFGPLVVCSKGVLDKDGYRTDNVDREFALNFETYDETKSHFFKLNTHLYAPGRQDCNNPTFVESNQKRAINGFMFFNTPAMNISVGEQVSWYIMSTGDKASQHSVKFNGQALTMNVFGNTKRTSVISVEAGTYYTAEMLADHASTWLISNHVGENMFKGAMASYTITKDPVP